MRFWLFLLFAAGVFVAAVIYALLYLNAPVRLQYGDWTAAPPLSVAIGATIMAAAAIVIALKFASFLLFLPRRMAQWEAARREKKQRELLQNTIRLTAYEDQRELLKVLSQLATNNPAAAWRAAQIAAELGNAKMADKCLRQAADGKDTALAAAAKAEICRRDQRLTESASVLNTAGALRGPAVLTHSLYDISRQREDWETALAAAVKLRDKMPGRWGATVNDVITLLFERVGTREEATRFWRENLTTEDKKNTAHHLGYIAALHRLGDENAAKEHLTKLFKQHNQHNAVLQMIANLGDKPLCEAAFTANEHRAEKNDSATLGVLADLAMRLELPGKENLYRQKLAALNPRRPIKTA